MCVCVSVWGVCGVSVTVSEGVSVCVHWLQL